MQKHPKNAHCIIDLPTSTNKTDISEIKDVPALLKCWQAIERSWLDEVLSADEENSQYMSLGSGCQVHPTVKINMPACIGDHVSIGPGCEIGP